MKQPLILFGDCAERLREIPDDAIDLIVTSPPYADKRKHTYGGVTPEKYVEWFMPIADELYRVLNPNGTFILNIKEKAINGERCTYVIELVLEMRKRGWLWTEEFVWYKKNSFPGKWPNRFSDAWEHLYQFNKSKSFAMYQDAVMVPVGDWRDKRRKNLTENDMSRYEPIVGSRLGRNMSSLVNRDMVYPNNVLHMATECGNKSHSAAFPEALPEWFIKLFTVEDDYVLDPFVGSGTTLTVAQRLNRESVGIEIHPDYYDLLIKKFS